MPQATTDKKVHPLLRAKQVNDALRLPEGKEKEAIMGSPGSAQRYEWQMANLPKYRKEQESLAAHSKKYGDEYGKMEAGYTHDARGQKVPLYRQARVTKRTIDVPEVDDGISDIGKSGGKPVEYQAEYDKGWDDYNKTLSEMRHRVQFGVRSRRSAELQSKGGKFGPGQAQRQAASVKAGQKRAGTLIAGQFDE